MESLAAPISVVPNISFAEKLADKIICFLSKSTFLVHFFLNVSLPNCKSFFLGKLLLLPIHIYCIGLNIYIV